LPRSVEDFSCSEVDLRITLEEVIEDVPHLLFGEILEDVHPRE
jgi:hypothetical protein